MKLSRLVPACALLIFASSGVAQANGLDPAIIIGGRNSAIFFTPGNTSVNLIFNTDKRCTPGFTTLGNVLLPSMTCGVVNLTNAPLTGFNFSFLSPQLLTLLISATANANLGTWTQNGNGTLATFMFTTPLPSPGDIRIDFVNFATNLPIGVSAVPEPATFTLLASGLGALLVRRRAHRARG